MPAIRMATEATPLVENEQDLGDVSETRSKKTWAAVSVALTSGAFFLLKGEGVKNYANAIFSEAYIKGVYEGNINGISNIYNEIKCNQIKEFFNGRNITLPLEGAYKDAKVSNGRFGYIHSGIETLLLLTLCYFSYKAASTNNANAKLKCFGANLLVLLGFIINNLIVASYALNNQISGDNKGYLEGYDENCIPGQSNICGDFLACTNTAQPYVDNVIEDPYGLDLIAKIFFTFAAVNAVLSVGSSWLFGRSLWKQPQENRVEVLEETQMQPMPYQAQPRPYNEYNQL